MNRIFLTLYIAFITSSWLTAQNCSQKLQEATRAFYQGNLREINSLIGGCVNTELRDQDKIEGLKLLVNANLLLNDNARADSYMYELLKVEPNYRLRESDLAEFRALFQTYEVKPQISIGVVFGSLFPNYNITTHQSFASDAQEPNDFNENVGMTVGLSGSYYLGSNLYFTTNVLWEKKSFQQSEKIYFQSQMVSSEERQYRINIPLTLRYIYGKHNLRPFLEVGYSLQHVIRSTGDITRIPLATDLPIPQVDEPFSVSGQALTSVLHKFGNNLVFGIGLQLPISTGHLQFGTRYELGLNNVVNNNRIYGNTQLLRDVTYVSDKYKIKTLSFTLAYIYSFYSPKKKSL